MRDARVVRAIPGTDLRPGDLVGETSNGTPILVRDLTPLAVEFLLRHPEYVRPIGGGGTPAPPARSNTPSPRTPTGSGSRPVLTLHVTREASHA